MKRLLLLLAASAMTAAPALAQHQGHHMPAPVKKAPVKKAPAKKPVAKKAPAKKSVAKKPAVKKAVQKKAATKTPVADPHAGHAMPAPQPAPDPHAGHAPAPVADPHAGHQVTAPVADPPLAPPPPEARSGPAHAADAVWGQGAMAPSRNMLRAEHGTMRVGKLLVDQAEVRVRDGRDGYFVNAEAWYGGDIDKLWLKAEAEGAFGERPGQAELQALWSHAIDPWFDAQAGLRYDFRPRGRAHAVLGVKGLAPYWIEVDAAAFVSDRGHVGVRIEAEHDARITQQWVLQPRAEFDFALQDSRRDEVGAGLSSVELGARLRYEITPQFAPYLGVAIEHVNRDTRRFRGEDQATGVSLVAGIRTWF
ncbi:copper resistance protein B [Sphingomonas sp.]|uniref:copper resistance protein B n=1 Tax=Sphingomonas sp. TaxID=28214 RepID=UPI00286D852F|nr:copper resistance protein B [Sphingomonas sp.]